MISSATDRAVLAAWCVAFVAEMLELAPSKIDPSVKFSRLGVDFGNVGAAGRRLGRAARHRTFPGRDCRSPDDLQSGGLSFAPAGEGRVVKARALVVASCLADRHSRFACGRSTRGDRLRLSLRQRSRPGKGDICRAPRARARDRQRICGARCPPGGQSGSDFSARSRFHRRIFRLPCRRRHCRTLVATAACDGARCGREYPQRLRAAFCAHDLRIRRGPIQGRSSEPRRAGPRVALCRGRSSRGRR